MTRKPDDAKHAAPSLGFEQTTPLFDAGSRPSGEPQIPDEDVVAGRYRIVQYLARGGMGEVYEAEDLELHERIALKTVRAEVLAADPRAAERFKREILLARKVTHPNVCRIFDLGFHRGVTFLTMELLTGETLAARLHRAGRMSVAEARPLVQQMIAALEAAHHAGIVHRDFKSANVMLVPVASAGAGAKVGPRIVITDFGLARGEVTPAALAETGPGAFVGTPSYMAPEQIEGGPISPATDVYALGIVLFEMVTGQLPFSAQTPLQTAVRRLKEPAPSPRRLQPDLDPGWEAVILRCLEREPRRRFATPRDVWEALLDPRKARAPRRLGRLAIGVAAPLLIGLGSWLALAGRVTPPEPALVGGRVLTLPSDRAAARAYVAGVERMWNLDERGARTQLELAVARAPTFAPARAQLAQSRFRLGVDGVDATRALADAALLPPDAVEDRLFIEATERASVRDWRQATDRYRQLTELRPSSLAYGLMLLDAQHLAQRPEDVSTTLARLRALPSPLGDDPRLDLAEVSFGQSVRLPYPARLQIARRAAATAEARGLRFVLAALRAQEAWFLQCLGELEQSVLASTAAQHLYLSLGDPARSLGPLSDIAVTQFLRGNLGPAQRALDEAITAARTQRLAREEAILLITATIVTATQGRMTDARQQLTAGQRLLSTLGLETLVNVERFVAGWLLSLEGDLVGAHRLFETQGLPRMRRDAEDHTLAWALAIDGDILRRRGDLVGARARLGEAIEIRTRLSQRTQLAEAKLSLAQLLLDEGRTVEAAEAASALIPELQAMDARDTAALAQVLLGQTQLRRGDRSGARHTADAALARLSATESPRLRFAILRLDAELRTRAEALLQLEPLRREAASLGLPEEELATRALLARLGKDDPRALAADATRLGFGLLARDLLR